MPDLTIARDTGSDKQSNVGDGTHHLSLADIDHFGALLGKGAGSDKATNQGQKVLPDLELHDDTKAGGKQGDEIEISRPMLKHTLKPSDGGMVDDMVKEQSEKLSLSPKGQTALKEALDAVAHSNNPNSVEQLGSQLPELFTVDGGKARQAFENSLKDLGYSVKSSPETVGREGLFSARHYTMDIREPKQLIGGGGIMLDYKVGAGIEAEPDITAEKYSLR